MKKTLVSIMLVLCCLFNLVGCGGDTSADNPPVSSSTQTVDINTEDENAVSVVIVDDAVIKASYVELFEVESVPNTCYLRLLVENKSEKSITVMLMDAYVNDMSIMMGSGVPMDIEAGKMSQNPFFFAGFTCDQVENIEFNVCVFDNSMNQIAETAVSIQP